MKRRNLLIWFSMIIVLVIAFVVPSSLSKFSNDSVRKISGPISKPLVSAGYRIRDFLSLIFEIGDLRRDNRQLTDDLIASRVEKSKTEELAKENESLKLQLQYKSAHPEMKLVLADVIGLDPTNYYGTLVIDKGSNDGVVVGQAVVSLGVLVGKIDQVFSDTSRVLLVTSKDSIVQAMLQSSRTTGILSGGISGMKLGSIPLDTPIAPDENIITSGLGGKLPKGIFIGFASNEISVRSDIFKTIEVVSPVNFSKLEYLFVITGV